MPGPKTTVALVVGGGALAVTGAVVALPLLGFSAAGVVAGSTAAVWQSAIGNVAAGSLFASLQSAGVLGLAATTKAAIAAAGSAAAAGIVKLNKKKKSQEEEEEEENQEEEIKK